MKEKLSAVKPVLLSKGYSILSRHTNYVLCAKLIWWCQAIGWEGMCRYQCTEKFHFNMRKNCFTVWVAMHWNRWPRDCGVSLSGHIQEMSGATLCHVPWDDTVWAGRLDQMTCCSPTQTDLFCGSLILCCENITYITYDSMILNIPNFGG